MTARTIAVALLLAILPMAGCGTAANLVCLPPAEGGKSPFGGVRQDMWCIENAANGDFSCRACPESEPKQYPQVALLLFCAADLPFTLIGDVVTWPYAAAYSFINQPIPTPPVLGPPAPPMLQAPVENGPQTPPAETLPEPKKQP